MNNFDENKEFVKRDSGSQTPQRPLGGTVRRPQNTVSRPQNGEFRRPTASAPQSRPTVHNTGAPGSAPQRPSVQRPTAQSPQRPAQSTGAARPTAPSRPIQGTQGRPIAPTRNTSRPNARISPNAVKESHEKKSVEAGTILRNILIFIAMLSAILALSFALLLSSLHVTPEKNKISYSFVIGDNQISSVTVNKVLYTNLTELSELCAFTVSGTKNCLRYTAFDEEYIEFTIGSISAKINGDIISMEGAALVRENENVWIPLSFVESYFTGLTVERDEDEHIIYLNRLELGKDENDDPIYSDITFSVKGSQSIGSIVEDPDIGEMVELNFANDLSEYEQYMNPEDRDAYLILVNKTNAISADDIPENLVSIADVRQDGRKEQMVECAEKALEAMFIELRSAGYTDVSVTSGYRSYNKQVSLFSTYLQREMANNPSLSEEQAKAIVLTYSAFPGTSEHQTGLCCDMHNLPSADVAFAQKEAYTWLKENCHKFGFIIRFPEDKVDITGYSFEPWHYRFVGRYHATRMYNLGMCLEEYIDYLAMANNN